MNNADILISIMLGLALTLFIIAIVIAIKDLNDYRKGDK
jgi:hypothetical protein